MSDDVERMKGQSKRLTEPPAGAISGENDPEVVDGEE